MATWKKVIVSGSNADLAQITSSAGILNSGDLTSLGNTFLGDTQSDKHHITGSLAISGSDMRIIGDNPHFALRNDATPTIEAATIGFAGGGGQIQLKDSAGNTKVRISNVNNNYFDRNTKIGGGFGNPSYMLDVNGDGRFLTNLHVSGSLRLGDSGADSHIISGSIGINALDDFEVQNNVGTYFKIAPSNDTVQIHPNSTTRKTFINTTSQIGTGIVSIASSVATSDSVTIGVGRTNTQAGLFVTGSSRFSGSVFIDGILTVTGDTLQEDLQTTGTTKLGNDMSDKTEVTGSFNVTGSSIFSGAENVITLDPGSLNAITINDISTGGGSDNNEVIVLKNSGTIQAIFGMTDNGSGGLVDLRGNNSSAAKLDILTSDAVT